MNMPIELSLYEALTETGVKPDAARRVERQIESAIQIGQETVRTEMLGQLATKTELLAVKSELKSDIQAVKSELLAVKSELKADIQAVKSDMYRALNDQTWKLAGLVVAANGIMLAAMKFFQ